MEVPASIDHSCRLPLDGRASHAYLHALIENNPTAVVVLDGNHCFQMCNAAFTRLFQYSPSDLETWGIDALIAGPEFMDEAGKATHAVLLGRQVHIRSKRRRRDGLCIDVEIRGVPLLMDGRVQGVFGLYQNAAERTEFTGRGQGKAVQPQSAGDAEGQTLARDLRNSVSQELALLSWNLNRLEKLLPEGDVDTAEVLRQTRQLAARCGDQVRTVGQHFTGLPAGTKTGSDFAVENTTSCARLRPQGMTEREAEIVRLLAMGLSSKEVAFQLNIGTRTVETHRMNVYRKLRLRNIADLVVYAIRTGLLPVG